MFRVKMLRDAKDYKTGINLLVDGIYELERTEEEFIRGAADGLWVEAVEAKPEAAQTKKVKTNG